MDKRILELAEGRVSVQTQAIRRTEEFSLFQQSNQTHRFILSQRDLIFTVIEATFRINLHTIVLGRHYVVGPLINFIEIPDEESLDEVLLHKRLRQIQNLHPKHWATMLCSSLDVPRCLSENEYRSKEELDSITVEAPPVSPLWLTANP
jgi:hypothetical protein